MLFATEKVIAYRSRADEAIDEWMWSGQGMTFMAVAAFSIALVVLICYLFRRSDY